MKCSIHPITCALSLFLRRLSAFARDEGLAWGGRDETRAGQVTALLPRNIQIGVKARPLSLVAFWFFAVALLVPINPALSEANPNLTTIYVMLSAFAFVGALGQVPVIGTGVWAQSRTVRASFP